MKPEQRATRDDTHDLKMPRQGVSLLNAMLGLTLWALTLVAVVFPEQFF